MPPDPTTAHYCDALYRAETAEARVARLEAEVERFRAEGNVKQSTLHKRGRQSLYCSFCGKRDDEVQMIAGPCVFICVECVELCSALAAEYRGLVEGEKEYASWFPPL